MELIRCRTCLYPQTKPDLHFDETGQCSACKSYEKRPNIDWGIRKTELLHLLDKHDGKCIVPSSGGKDSTYQVIKLLELGADVTIVTATTCHLTPIGRRNIDNLARYAPTIEVTPNQTVRAKLNRLGLELVGDISHPEHMAIFSTPFRIAIALNIPLIFYGECPQNQYGGPLDSEDAKQLTRRWRSEYGGFNGLRPSDFIGMEGITERDMQDYMFPDDIGNVEAHFLGQYIPWDSHENARDAIEHGLETKLPTQANWWEWENLDNAQTGLHDYMMYKKFGYGRITAQISVDIRNGRISRDEALGIIKFRESKYPTVYAGVPLFEVLEHIGMTHDQLFDVMDKFTNWSLFTKHIFGKDKIACL